MAIKVHTLPMVPAEKAVLEARLNELAATNKILAVTNAFGQWYIVAAESEYRARRTAHDEAAGLD